MKARVTVVSHGARIFLYSRIDGLLSCYRKGVAPIAAMRNICYLYPMSWQDNILNAAEQIRDLILQTKRIAVLGIKTEAQADQPSVYVPKYLQDAGFEIVPVPVRSCFSTPSARIRSIKSWYWRINIPKRVRVAQVYSSVLSKRLLARCGSPQPVPPKRAGYPR
jgi:hypothetical protein